jgi:acetolactate synthase small subunit
MNAAAILQILNIVDSLFVWLSARGISRDRVITLLQAAEAEGRDVTTTEVQVELDALQERLDATQEQIDGM